MELPGKMQFTLVAFYGSKPPRFSGLIRSCQDELARLLLASFHPYDIDQVHGTLIGLEGVRQGETTLNSNFNALRSEMRHMDLRQILGLLSSTPLLPMKLQIGGFRHYEHFDFTSRGLHPYLRSFAIRDRIAVAMGWPTDSGRHPASLDELRRVFQNVNVLHQYHQKETDKDNDFFFVLGRVDRSDGDEFHIQKAEEILRSRSPRGRRGGVARDRRRAGGGSDEALRDRSGIAPAVDALTRDR